MMAVYYGKPLILLIDEYDVPLAKASTHGYYQEMLEVMRAMMSTCLKDNRNLSFAVVTGCLRIAKESIFTGTNKMERSDVVVSDSDHDRAAVFEVKMVREKEKLEPACTAALDQHPGAGICGSIFGAIQRSQVWKFVLSRNQVNLSIRN